MQDFLTYMANLTCDEILLIEEQHEFIIGLRMFLDKHNEDQLVLLASRLQGYYITRILGISAEENDTSNTEGSFNEDEVQRSSSQSLLTRGMLAFYDNETNPDMDDLGQHLSLERNPIIGIEQQCFLSTSEINHMVFRDTHPSVSDESNEPNLYHCPEREFNNNGMILQPPIGLHTTEINSTLAQARSNVFSHQGHAYIDSRDWTMDLPSFDGETHYSTLPITYPALSIAENAIQEPSLTTAESEDVSTSTTTTIDTASNLHIEHTCEGVLEMPSTSNVTPSAQTCESDGRILERIFSSLDSFSISTRQPCFTPLKKLEIARAIANLFRPNLDEFLKTYYTNWQVLGLWHSSDVPTPFNQYPTQGSNHDELAVAYICISQLEKRIEEDPIRARFVLLKFHAEYLKLCANNTSMSSNHLQRGRGGTSLIIDEILRRVYKDWDKTHRTTKDRLRARFHSIIRSGKRWSMLTQYLGLGILLSGSSKTSAIIKKTTFTNEMLDALGCIVTQESFNFWNSSLESIASQLLQGELVKMSLSFQEILTSVQGQLQFSLNRLESFKLELGKYIAKTIH